MQCKESWTKLFGPYKGNEFVSNCSIVRPMNQWGGIDSNNKYFLSIYRATNDTEANQILDAWKQESCEGVH